MKPRTPASSKELAREAWAAVPGDEPLKIMHRLGHRQFSTTMLHVREAEQLREGFGESRSRRCPPRSPLLTEF